jgi:hypothetical protein
LPGYCNTVALIYINDLSTGNVKVMEIILGLEISRNLTGIVKIFWNSIFFNMEPVFVNMFVS